MRHHSTARRTTDWTLPIGREHDLRIVDRPAHALDPDALGALVDELRRVADRCLPPGHLRYGILSGARERLEAAVVAVVYERRTRRPVGFSAMSRLPVTLGARRLEVLHAGLCMIAPEVRRGGLCWLLTTAPALVAFARKGFTTLWVTNVTQVPAVAGVFTGAAGAVHPAPGRDGPPSPTHRRIAEQLMEHHRAAFGVGDDAELDGERFVIRNAYTGGSDALKKRFEDADEHRDPEINRLCRELLDYDRGDDLLQVGHLTVGVVCTLVLRFAARLVWRGMRRLRPAPAARAADTAEVGA